MDGNFLVAALYFALCPWFNCSCSSFGAFSASVLSTWRYSAFYQWCKEAVSMTGNSLFKCYPNWCSLILFFFFSVAKQSSNPNVFMCFGVVMGQSCYSHIMAIGRLREIPPNIKNKRFASMHCNSKDTFWKLQVIFHEALLTCCANEEEISKFLNSVGLCLLYCYLFCIAATQNEASKILILTE